MSVLEDLINKDCPNGVEYTNIGNIATVTKLAGFEFTKYVTYSDKGKIIALRGLNVKKGKLNLNEVKYIDESDLTKLTRSKLYIDDMLFTYVGTIGEVALIDKNDKYYLAPNVALIRFNKELIVSSFMKYYFQSNIFFNTQINKLLQSSSMKNIPMEKIRKFSVPLPPIEIQKEIVHILDTFTEYQDCLNEELTLRKKQYEHYRDKILTFGDDVEWKILDEIIISLNTGLNPRQFFRLNTDDAQNYYVTIRELQNNTIKFTEKTDRINDEALKLCNKRSNLEIVDVLFSGTGTIGETAIIEEYPNNWNIKEGIYTIKPNKTFLVPKFLMYLLKSSYIKNMYLAKADGGTVKSVPMKEMRNLKIPVPPLEEQERIVKILDRFDVLCNDISSGLPAEIEMRKKQYEYYRDKLLTFKEKKIKE